MLLQTSKWWRACAVFMVWWLVIATVAFWFINLKSGEQWIPASYSICLELEKDSARCASQMTENWKPYFSSQAWMIAAVGALASGTIILAVANLIRSSVRFVMAGR